MLKMFTVYDSKVNAYLNPIFLRSKGEAIRVFTETVNSSDHMIAKNPEDYTLFELGSWDECSCKFVLNSTPISVGLALEFVRSSDFKVGGNSVNGSIVPQLVASA